MHSQKQLRIHEIAMSFMYLLEWKQSLLPWLVCVFVCAGHNYWEIWLGIIKLISAFIENFMKKIHDRL